MKNKQYGNYDENIELIKIIRNENIKVVRNVKMKLIKVKIKIN